MGVERKQEAEEGMKPRSLCYPGDMREVGGEREADRRATGALALMGDAPPAPGGTASRGRRPSPSQTPARWPPPAHPAPGSRAPAAERGAPPSPPPSPWPRGHRRFPHMPRPPAAPAGRSAGPPPPGLASRRSWSRPEAIHNPSEGGIWGFGVR